MDKQQDISRIQTVIDECVPRLKAFAKGRCAVSISGSLGKGTFDHKSDVDFRLYCDEIVGGPRFWEQEPWKSYCRLVEDWRTKGIDIDYCWIRTVGEIDAKLEAWLNGQPSPEPLVWALWGYHLPTDLYNQVAIDDPDGLVARWQAKLNPYPRTLQQAIIAKHLESLNYWRSDYHYRNKVDRGDKVFLASITVRLVHDIMQILFAINKVYYVGDGNNLKFAAQFPIQPQGLAERVNAILYPTQTENVLLKQYEAMVSLIDDVVPLAGYADAD
jgi:hypothetical protein